MLVLTCQVGVFFSFITRYEQHNPQVIHLQNKTELRKEGKNFLITE